ncbi:MAG: HdeD family acid-resistance protein, partial [Hyphomicrobiales bacterium]|nr:HdeD family acid-resistance protein [Hyphomicrobiales bacterium]
MIVTYGTLDLNAIARRWWMLVIRGVAAVIFGVLAIAWPGISLLALVLLWGAYALIDGASAIAMAIRAGGEGRRWGWLLFEGIVGVAAAFFTAINPGITAFALLMLIAAWAVLTGIAEIVTAIELRRQIRGEWLLAASGVLSIVFGALTVMFPGAGALTLVTVVGAYAIAFGVLLTVLGFRIRSVVTREERLPVG